MDLKKLKVQDLNKQEMKKIEGGGDIVRAIWYVIGLVGGAYGNAIQNERTDGGTVVNWKN